MNFLKYGCGLVLGLVLTACGGGGGNASAPVATGGASKTPATVEVLKSENTLLSNGMELVITAFVKSTGNVGIAAQPVTFSASSGTLQSASLVTDSNGAVTAKLLAGADKSVRDIKVTVVAGAVSGSIVVPVTGTSLSVAGSGSLQAGGSTSQFTVRAVDASNLAISGAQLSVSSTLNNVLSASAFSTDSSGNATFFYSPNNPGTDILTVSGLGTTASTKIEINAVDFKAISPASGTLIAIGSPKAISVQYRVSGAGLSGQSVAFSTTRGVITTNGLTDSSGVATATLSSTTAGPAVVTAQISGVGSVNLPVQFVATTPATIVVQANPGGILPNTSGTTNQSTIEAVVRDSNGNAVAGRQVNFTTLQDLSNGTLSPGNAITDSNGRAKVQFVSGGASTQAGGVIIQATVASTSITGTTSLTVNGQALFITIAFGNEISNVDQTTYSKTFSVYVTDANGVAVGNQVVSLSAIPTEYYKGSLINVGGLVPKWVYGSTPTSCVNEDINLNGILDFNEDINGNALLTPGNIVVVAPGNVTTNTSGRATFELQYGEQFAPWAKVQISARASVAGTESRQSVLFDLVGSTDDFSKVTPPAGLTSPFGVSSLCADPN